MPIYEYQCDACQHHLETLQKISDAPLRKCPACGKSRLKRLISPPVFRLKGSGWYETDFKSDKENKRNLAVEKDDAPASAGTETSKAADSKAAKPAEAKPESAKPAPDAPVSSKPAAARPKPKAKARPARKKGR